MTPFILAATLEIPLDEKATFLVSRFLQKPLRKHVCIRKPFWFVFLLPGLLVVDDNTFFWFDEQS